MRNILFSLSFVLVTNHAASYDETLIRPIRRLAPKYFHIQGARTKLVLDIRDKSALEGAEVIMAPKDDTRSQMWAYTESAITNSLSCLSLAVDSQEKPTLNPIVMKKWDTGNDKKWFFDSEGRIRAAHWDYRLTQLENNTVIGTYLPLFECQQFDIVYI